MESILNIEVSCFANYNSPANPRPVNLLQWLISSKYADDVNTIRNIDDKTTRDKIKATLPAITPSGLFSHRSEKCLIRHSGFIQFDIDMKGNEAITNYSDLKEELCKIPQVAYCGLSVSGKGFWGLISIEQWDKHDQYFKFIENWFKGKGLIIDPSPKSVSSLRGYAYDQAGYFNHAAKNLKQFYIEPVKKAKPLITFSHEAGNIFQYSIKFAEGKAGSFQEGNRHNYIFHLCCYLCYMGIDRKEAESWIDINLLSVSEINSNCISYPYENYKARETKAIKQPVPVKPQPATAVQNFEDTQSETSKMPATPKPERWDSFTPWRAKRQAPGRWDGIIAVLENYFAGIAIPTHPVKLNKWSTIPNVARFIESYFTIVKAQNGNRNYRPYLERLQELMGVLQLL